MKRQLLTDLRRCVILLVASILLGTLLLTVMFMLPSAPMQKHVMDSLTAINREDLFAQLIGGYTGSSMDGWTDTLMLSTAAYPAQEDSALTAAMRTAHLRTGPNDPPMTALQVVNKDPESERLYRQDYPRYWHGYLLFLRPLLLLTDYSGVRLINTGAQLLLLAAVIWQLTKRGKGWLIPPVAFAWLTMCPPAVNMSLQFSDMYYISFGGMLALLWGWEQLHQKQLLVPFFMLLGILTAYVDLLTAPLLSFLLPFGLLVMLQPEGTWKEHIARAFGCAAGWAAGYLLMWVAKWAVGTLILHQNVFESALHEVDAMSAMRGGGRAITLKEVWMRNLWGITGNTGLLMLTAVYAVYLAVQALHSRTLHIQLPALFLLGCVCIAPAVWYAMASWHSYLHYYFTYRLLAASVFGICGALAMCTHRRDTNA